MNMCKPNGSGAVAPSRGAAQQTSHGGAASSAAQCFPRPGCLDLNTHHVPPLLLPGDLKVFPQLLEFSPSTDISPVHPCENRVFKAETAKEYIQESMIKATILCTMEHPSRKCTELVPQNNYMCRVHCKHSFYVHQHSWGQCLKI